MQGASKGGFWFFSLSKFCNLQKVQCLYRVIKRRVFTFLLRQATTFWEKRLRVYTIRMWVSWQRPNVKLMMRIHLLTDQTIFNTMFPREALSDFRLVPWYSWYENISKKSLTDYLYVKCFISLHVEVRLRRRQSQPSELLYCIQPVFIYTHPDSIWKATNVAIKTYEKCNPSNNYTVKLPASRSYRTNSIFRSNLQSPSSSKI